MTISYALWELIPGYGSCPSENISHKATPNDQTSEYVLNLKLVNDSTANHLNGNLF